MRIRFKALAALFAVSLSGFAVQAAEAAKTPPDPKPVIAAMPTVPPPSAAGKENYGAAPAVPAAGVFPVLPFEAADDATPQLLPVAANHPLDGPHDNITRAVIFIHDATRDANGAVAMLAALAGPDNDQTLILAPQFMLATDIARFTGRLPEGIAHWPLGTWEDGGESAVEPPQKGVSSFGTIDLLLLYLGDKQFFPALQDIVIAGHGAGGDFTLRYAALGQAPDLIDTKTTNLRFVAANASSYLYFTSLRPLSGKPGFALPDAKACPAYNDYKYGLNHLNRYGQRGGSDAIRLRYPSRRVMLLAGTKAEDAFPDMSCAAMLEGPNRFTRAANYDVYIGTIFGGGAQTPMQSFDAVANAGYDPVAMFGSPCGISALFGTGTCQTSATPKENSQ